MKWNLQKNPDNTEGYLWVPRLEQRVKMTEEKYLVMRDTTERERHRRRVEAWLLVFLGFILVAALLIVLLRPLRDSNPVVTESAALRAARNGVEEMRQTARSESASSTSHAPSAATLAEIARREAEVARVEANDQARRTSQEESNKETDAWARIALTTIIGFITGYVSGRRSNGPNIEGGSDGVQTDVDLPPGGGAHLSVTPVDSGTPPTGNPAEETKENGGAKNDPPAPGATDGEAMDPKDLQDHVTDNTDAAAITENIEDTKGTESLEPGTDGIGTAVTEANGGGNALGVDGAEAPPKEDEAEASTDTESIQREGEGI